MKVTIDIPAPSQLLELVSRLKQKNSNYKTQLKQLGRAHFITKRLLQDRERDIADLRERLGRATLEVAHARQELDEVRCFMPPPRHAKVTHVEGVNLIQSHTSIEY